MRFVLDLGHRVYRWRTTPETRWWCSPIEPSVRLVMVNKIIDGRHVVCREHDVRRGGTLNLRAVYKDTKISSDPEWDGRRMFGPERIARALIALPGHTE